MDFADFKAKFLIDNNSSNSQGLKVSPLGGDLEGAAMDFADGYYYTITILKQGISN